MDIHRSISLQNKLMIQHGYVIIIQNLTGDRRRTRRSKPVPETTDFELLGSRNVVVSFEFQEIKHNDFVSCRLALTNRLEFWDRVITMHIRRQAQSGK
jgi:hypothetical protein